MRIGFAFFRAEHGGLGSQAIAWRTGGPYSHVEFYMPDSYVEEEGTGVRRHLCFSSYGPDGGVRWKYINVTGGWWELLEFVVDPDLLKASVQWANTQVGKGYDWAGIWGFVNPWRKGGDPGRWFCSEICRVLALRLGVLGFGGTPADRVSPMYLWKMLRIIEKG